MRRKLSKVKFSGATVMDTVISALIVDKAPALISKVVPIDPQIQAVAGVGAGYLTGMFLKKPMVSNISIGIGLVNFISPMIDDLLGGGGTPLAPVTQGALPNPGITGAVQVAQTRELADYINLNDYVSDPSVRQSFDNYRMSY